MEDEHVPALGIREPAEEAGSQDAIADVHRRAHRPRGDAVRLDDVALDHPGQPERHHHDDEQLEQGGNDRLLTRGSRKTQLDPLGALLAIGRSGHALG